MILSENESDLRQVEVNGISNSRRGRYSVYWTRPSTFLHNVPACFSSSDIVGLLLKIIRPPDRYVGRP